MTGSLSGELANATPPLPGPRPLGASCTLRVKVGPGRDLGLWTVSPRHWRVSVALNYFAPYCGRKSETGPSDRGIGAKYHQVAALRMRV